MRTIRRWGRSRFARAGLYGLAATGSGGGEDGGVGYAREPWAVDGVCAAQYGIRVVIVVPFGNSAEKNRAMRALGAELVESGEDFQARVNMRSVWSGRTDGIGCELRPEAGDWCRDVWAELFSACGALETIYVRSAWARGCAGRLLPEMLWDWRRRWWGWCRAMRRRMRCRLLPVR